MDIFSYSVTVQPDDCAYGRIKLSALLHTVQEASGKHCDSMGLDWDTLYARGLFWAVLRHRITVNRLPGAGENMTVETWPLPTTRSAYPRAVRALDCEGRILFEVISLWVFMSTDSRTMILPGKSGVEIPGFLRGDEPAGPGSILPTDSPNSCIWQVSEEDLDQNGHVNNCKYLDPVARLIPGREPREVTVCYLAEVLPGQEITLYYTLSEDGLLTVDGRRRKTDVCQQTERVFAVRLSC